MPTGPRLSDYAPGAPNPWLRLLSPTSVGAISAAALAASPRSLPSREWLRLPSGTAEVLAVVPGRVYCLLVGFALGYGVTKSLGWLRWKCLKGLLSYHGWIYSQKCTKSKLWALCLKLLKGPGPFSTLEFQNVLPAQPLPSLDETLDRWIEVTRQFLSPEEHELTVQAVEGFRVNEGIQLQAYLQERYATKVNWLSDYWLTAAYLSCRSPNAVNSNFYFTNAIAPTRTTDPLARAANIIYYSTKYAETVFNQTLPPVQLMELVPLCMYNYKFLFNSTRLPGEHMDTLACHPGEKHILVMRKGHYFKMDMFPKDHQGKPKRLTIEEVYAQLSAICKEADEVPEPPLPVACMTAQRRDVWHKNREVLKANNKDVLHLIDSALFLIVLDEHTPKTHEEQCRMLLAGNGYNRWFDKSFNYIIFEDCSQGANVEHSVIDATVMSSVAEYCLVAEQYENGDIVRDGSITPRDLSSPTRLTWDLTGMEAMISEAMSQFKALSEEFDLCVLNTRYGKAFMKKSRLSPDGYIQMAMQLAYYRLQKEIVKTYEPSTGRLFNLGRTETVHPSSKAGVEWVVAMDDEKVPRKECESLLRDAIGHQTRFRLDATAGYGCDRHLLGLYCASRELGMDVPNLFRDKPFQLPFKLSTSQTPTRIVEAGVDVLYEQCGGGFGAVCKEGYGVCYIHLGEDMVNLHITCWNSCPDTDARQFSAAIDTAMEDMKKLLS